MDNNRIDLLLNASKQKISDIPGLTQTKLSNLTGEDTIVNPFDSTSNTKGLASSQTQIPTRKIMDHGIDRTPLAGLQPIDRTPIDLSEKAVEEGAKLYDSQNTNPLLNTGKAVASGILDTASSVARSPEKLYKVLGGDYLEKGSEFEKAHPTYTKAVKGTMDWMSKGANAIDNLNKMGIGYDDYKAQQLQSDLANEFDEGDYVSGLFKSMAHNPQGAIELAGNMYGFSKAMGAKGFTGVPAIVGSFTDNADQAKELFVKEHGREPNKTELGAILGLSAISTSIDTAASKYLLGGAEGEKLATNLTKSVDKLVSKVPNSVARVAMGGTLKIGAMMGTEGLQEGSQQALIDLAGTQDVSKLGEDKYLKDIYLNTAMGAIAGPGMHALNVTSEIAPLAMKGTKELYDKAQELKGTSVQSQEQTSTSSNVPTSTPLQSPDEMLKNIDLVVADLESTGDLTDENRAAAQRDKQLWTDVKSAVDSADVYKSLVEEKSTTEDPERKAYLKDVLKKVKQYTGKVKTLADAVDGTTNEDAYVAADSVVKGIGSEWQPDLGKPMDIADTIQSVQTLRDLRTTHGVHEKNTQVEDEAYDKAVGAVKHLLSQQLSKYPNYDKMSDDQKVGLIGDELHNWLRQSVPEDEIGAYMESMIHPVTEAMAESKVYGSGPDAGMTYKGKNVAGEVKAAPQPEAKTEWKQQEAKTKAKIETKLFADADMNVENTSTDTHTGVSKGSINKLAETFKVPAAKVKSALDIAFQRMQIKKMADVSKEANEAQYEIYHGKDGILPNFIRFKKAAETNNVEEANTAINNLVKRYTDQMYKYMIAVDSIKPVQDKIEALGKDVTLEQLKEAVGDVRITIQGAKGSKSEYTIDGMSIAKLTDSVPENVRDQITLGKGGHIFEAVKESVLHLQDMFDREGLGELLPEVRFNKVLRDDLYNNLVDKITALMDKRDTLAKVGLDPTVKRTSEELDAMEEAAKELAKVEKELATRIKDQQEIFKSRSGNLYQYNNTTFKEETPNVDVSKKMGQETGTITKAEATRLGLDLDAGTIKDYEPLKSVDEYKQILDKIAALKEERSNARTEVNEANKDIVGHRKNRKTLLDKLRALSEELNEDGKAAIKAAKVGADKADALVTKLATELMKDKARAKELKSALVFLEKNEEVFKNATVNAEQLVKMQSEYGKWMNALVKKTGKIPTAKERNDKLREMVQGTTLLETIVNDLNKVAKIGVVLARKLMGVYTYDKTLAESVRAEINAVAAHVETTQAALDKAKVDMKETVRQSRLVIVKALRENGMTPDMSAKAIENALMKSTRLRTLEKKANKSKKLSEERLKEINDEIKALENELKGTRLYKENIVNNIAVVEALKKAGVEVKAPLDMLALKTRGSMLGNMNFSDIKTMMPTDKETIGMLDKVTTQATKGMEKLYNGTIGTKMLGKLVAQNPALMLIARIDKVEGKEAYEFNYDKNMLNALMLAVSNYIAINGNDLAINTKLDVSKIIGVGEYDQKVNQVYHQMMGMGKLHTTIASRIGDDFVRAMGISQGEMGTEQYRKLVADLGNTALVMAKANGLLTEPRMTATQWNQVAGENSKIPEDSEVNVKFVKLVKSALTDVKARAHNSTVFKRMNDILNSLDEQSTYRTHKIFAVKNGKKYEIDGSPFGIPEGSQEVMRHLEDQVYVLQEKPLQKMLAVYRTPKGKSLVMEKAGWRNLEDMDNELQDDKDAQESINREIEDTLAKLDEMEAAYSRGEITEDVYFNWFFTSNGRYMIDSIGINPQADKHFSRFLLVPEQSSNREWNLNDPIDKLMMADGIAQAFGHDIDKSTEKDTEEFTTKIVKQFQTDKEFEQKVMNGEIEVPHFGHALQAIEFMRNMKRSGKFTGTLTAEYDAKTSGPMHKLMQAPILDDGEFGVTTQEWLNKGAILVNSGFKESSAAHVKSVEDGYQTITKEANKELGNQVPVFVSNDKIVTDYRKLFAGLNGLLGKLVDEKGVTKAGRQLGKSAFVPFGYAASTETIKRNIGDTLAYDILKKIVDPSYKNHAVIMKALGMDKKQYAQLQSDLRSKPANEVRIKVPAGVITYKKDVLGILGEMFTMTYGEAYKSAMNGIFQPQVAMNTAIKDVTSAMFRMWKIKYDQMMESEPNASVERKMEVIRSLEDYFPLIKAPWSKDKQDGIAIFDTKRAKMKNEELPTVNTTTNVDGELSSETVQAMITEMEETFAAGAVLPIHWIDGTQIASVLMRGGITGVHDAIVIGMKGSETQQTIKDMNQAMYDVNKNYNMFDEFQLAMLNMLDKVDETTLKTFIHQEAAKNEKGINLTQLKDRVSNIAENIRRAREKLYGNEVTVGNIIAFRNTEFKGSGNENVNKNETAIKNMLKKLDDRFSEIEEQINTVSSKAVAEEGIESITKKLEVLVDVAEKMNADETYLDRALGLPVKEDKRSETTMLKTVGDKVVFASGKTKETFKTLDDLVKFANEYNSLMIGEGKVANITDVEDVKSMFATLDKMGIPFKELEVNITPSTSTKTVERGLYEVKGNKMYLYYDKTHTGANPVQVVLHEYVHAITMANLNSNPEIKEKVRELMDHVLKERPGLNVYAMKNEAEFLAEAIAEPRFQQILAEIPSYKNTGVLEYVKNLFKELLESLSKKELKAANALTDALELVVETANVEEAPFDVTPMVATQGKAKLSDAIIDITICK